MPELKGTKTEENLKSAFAGESQARNKYTYFASKARKDGFEQIAAIFQETADNEKEHAKIWFKYLGGINDTADNLLKAAGGEHFEWTQMYAQMAKEAREEGFNDIAEKFEMVGRIEKEHEERYLALLENIKQDKVFKKDAQVMWRCSNCGHTQSGGEAPEICPVCSHPKAYFEMVVQNF